MKTLTMTPSLIEGATPIAKGVFLEALRRKEFYSFFILAFVFALFAIVVRFIGIEQPATGTFILNLGISYAYIAAHLLVLILAVRQIPAEIENRTLYPIMAKPIGRFTYIIGKWSAITLTGFIVFITLFLIIWLPMPKLETYAFATLLQTIALQFLSISLLAALGLLFSLFAPPPVSMILLGLIFAVVQKLTSIILARLIDSPLHGLLEWIFNYIPNFSKLNLITRYTDGIAPVGFADFIGLIGYGGVLLAMALFISTWLFRRKAL